MGYNLVTNIETCYSNIPHLLYYSHIPTALVSLFLGFYVFFKNRRSLPAKLLMIISILFMTWSVFDIIIFVSPDSRKVMFFWSVINLVEMSVSVLTLFFAYAFLTKKDTKFWTKIIYGSLLVSFAIFIPTKLNLPGFDITNCEAQQGPLIKYFYVLESLFFFSLIIYLIRKIIGSDRKDRKQVILFSIGSILFLASFSGANVISSITAQWTLLQYSLIGMPIFMGFLVYLIIRYRVFNIKLIATQALVVALLILLGSQFFFIQDLTSKILNAITLALALAFGYILVQSVKLEVQRKEELENLSTQLAVANDKLHQLDKAKSEFISIASHQLRTPLTAIKGFVSLLLEGTYGEVPQTQRPALEKVYISNERLVQLVEDLLNISRMDAGRMEFDFQEGQIEDLVKEAVETLELSARQKDLYLNWQKPTGAFPKIKMDITKIKEVISNMIDNAIKYTQKGGVTVKLERGSFYHHNEREQKNVVRVIVSDTGIGMDKADIDMIFNKFQRGREVSNYHTDGTGLGMYIGRKVVEAHRGLIWAESEGKGKGSKFILELPII